MQCLNGHKQWQELFDDRVSKIWTDEPLPLLKNISMMLFCFNREIKKIKDSLNHEASQLRNVLSRTNLNDSTKTDIDEIVKTQGNKRTPPMSSKLSHALSDPSTIISEDSQNSETICSSPEIKRTSRRMELKRKLRRKRKLEQQVKLNEENEDLDATPSLVDNTSKKQDKMNNVETFDASWAFFHKPSGALNSVQNNSPDIFTQEIDFSKRLSTPQKSDNDLDNMIQGTPLPNNKSKGSFILRSRNRSVKTLASKSKNATLTQMFPSHSDRRKRTDRRMSPNKTLTKPSENDSLIEITRMVDLLNEPSSCSTAVKSEAEDIADLIDSLRYEDFVDKEGEDNSLNSAIVVDDISLDSPAVKPHLNDFLAKAQNVPADRGVEEVVRGKARQQLPGWTCKDCERFYLAQGLGPEVINNLNKCTRHRSYARPREDTLPGYWDMDINTPKDKR